MLGNVTLDLDPIDRGCSIVGGLDGPTGWGSIEQPGRYARARYLFMYMLCEVEKSNVRTLCFGVQASIDYRMPKFVSMTPFKVPNSVFWVSRQGRCVLIRSNFPAVPKPFR
ncbi:hypothetical protein M9H77_21549 [Catharanthus roseus]|uniref:Uncharacterized protein n=1 Tax=Catharanthus roseus TaxID=4058 RepID=A0ACC0ANN2_CATRO|nr:hypothetical protein M9H77_21549 [Catharanthus roseus]